MYLVQCGNLHLGLMHFAECLFPKDSRTSGIVDLNTKNHMSLSCLVAEICQF